MNLPALLATLLLAAAPAGESAQLQINLSGFRSADGQALIAVYRGGAGFPGTPAQAWKTVVAPISGGRVRVTLADVPPGEYAVSVAHDENGNNALDTNWIGIPREGVGTSNNAKGRMGPPKSRDARFELGAAGAVQNIAIVYL